MLEDNFLRIIVADNSIGLYGIATHATGVPKECINKEITKVILSNYFSESLFQLL